MKKWNGSSWTNATVKKWNGSSWVNATVKKWNGSSWVAVGTTTTKSVTLPSAWSSLYDVSNKKRTDRNDTKTLQQGKTPNDSKYGISKSLVGFNTASVIGKNITSIRIYLRSIHWYYISGGTVHLGWHGHKSSPTTFSHSKYNGKQQAFSARLNEQWIEMPQEFINGVKNGSIRGFSIFYNSNEWHGYGLFNGHGSTNPPKMQVYYNE